MSGTTLREPTVALMFISRLHLQPRSRRAVDHVNCFTDRMDNWCGRMSQVDPSWGRTRPHSCFFFFASAIAPAPNQILASGCCPVCEMEEAGLPSGSASNDEPDAGGHVRLGLGSCVPRTQRSVPPCGVVRCRAGAQAAKWSRLCGAPWRTLHRVRDTSFW